MTDVLLAGFVGFLAGAVFVGLLNANTWATTWAEGLELTAGTCVVIAAFLTWVPLGFLALAVCLMLIANWQQIIALIEGPNADPSSPGNTGQDTRP